MLSGDNGILQKATDAKENTIVENEKEQIELAYISAAINKLGNHVTDLDLQNELNKSVGQDKTNVKQNDNNTLNVLFYDTNNNYYINGSGKTSKIDENTQYVKDNIKIGDYINYNINYTDIKSLYEYSSENGWRLLYYGFDDDDPDLCNLRIISTGVPCGIYINANNIGNLVTDKSDEYVGTDGLWAGNQYQVEKYSEYCGYTNLYNPNMKISSGLYYNFEKIIFSGSTPEEVGWKNLGYFKKVNNIEPSSNTTGNIFRLNELSSKITNIRTITLIDMNQNETANVDEPATGLYILQNNIAKNAEDYWIASPKVGYTGTIYKCSGDQIQKSGFAGDTYYDGLRVIVELKNVKLKYDEKTKIWNIE